MKLYFKQIYHKRSKKITQIHTSICQDTVCDLCTENLSNDVYDI